MTVASCMLPDPPALAPETSLGEAAARLERSGTGAAPVLDGERLVGLLCADTARAATANGAAAAPVRGRMVPHPETVEPAMPLEDAAVVLLYSGLDHLPVTEDGRVVGVLSRSALEELVPLADRAPRGV
jgi:CBS domain-containing protein